jgi:iron complex outermembrane receptor protein
MLGAPTMRDINRKMRTWMATTAIIMLPAYPTVVNAQAALEEIIVTSQKREENLQDVPISVAIVGGEQLLQRGAWKLEDIMLTIPTLHVGAAQIGNQLFIRGIGSGVNAGFEQSVGTYIDGLYYGRGRLSALNFLDIERIEVLKGPQGTLFGKNSIAGALNITTARPTREAEGYVTAQYGFTFEEPVLEGVLSGPISETLAVRVAGRWSELNRGWIKNAYRDRREPQLESAVGRISVLWKPSENFDLLAKATVNRFVENGRSSELINVGGAYFGNPGSQAELLAPYGEFGVLDKVRNVGGTPGTAFDRDRSANTVQSYGLTANYYLDDFTITSITGFITYDARDTQDNDVTPLDLMAMEVGEEYDQFSQEIRLTSPTGGLFEYLVGAYYQRDTLDALQYINISTLQIREAGYAGPPLHSGRYLTLHQKTESWAVFGQFKVNFNEDFSAAVGLRYSEDRKSVLQQGRLTAFNQPNVPLSSNPLMPVGAAPGVAQVGIWGQAPLFTWEHDVDTVRKEDHFTPSLQLTWNATDDVMLYATGSKGYKSGGFDAFFARYAGQYSGPIPRDNSALDTFEFEDEKVKSVEIGTKTTLLNGAAELNIAAFYSKFSDVQVSTFSGGIDVNVQNAATTISRGIEVEGRWRLTENLSSTGSFAYVDSYYKNFPYAECYFAQPAPDCSVNPATGLNGQDLSGKTTQQAPKINAHVSVEHVLPIQDAFLLTSGIGITYSSKYHIAADLDPRLVQKSYALVDARLAFSDVEGVWEVALVGNNLTNRKVFSWANDTPLAFGSAYVHINRLRSFALQARYNF